MQVVALVRPEVAAALVFAGLAATTSAAQTTGYVTQSAADTLALLDTENASAFGSVGVGDAPAHVAITRDGTRAYVSNMGADSVSVIDTASGAVVATIAVDDQPSSLAISPDGQRVYVMTNNGTLDVVEAATSSVTAHVLTSNAYGMLALNPDGSRLYIAGGTVSVLDTTTNTIVSSFNSGTGAVGIALSPDGTRAYVLTYTYYFTPQFSAAGSVAVFDTATQTQLASITTYSLPSTIALSHDGTRAYVGLTATWVNTGYGAGFAPAMIVATIDTGTNTVVGWTPLANKPAGLAVTPDDAHVYVAVPSASQVAVIDAATSTVATTIAVAGTPGDVAIEPPKTPTTTYCTAGLTTNGCSAQISAIGHASASAVSGFELSVANVEGQRNGLIFYGVNGPSAAPWGSGSSFVCVKAPTQRTTSQNSAGTNGACDGAFALDFNAYFAANSSALGHPLDVATSICAQAWFRDPPAPKGTNLSNALEFVLEP